MTSILPEKKYSDVLDIVSKEIIICNIFEYILKYFLEFRVWGFFYYSDIC